MKKTAAVIVALVMLVTALGMLTVHADAQYKTQTEFEDDYTIKGQALDIIRGDNTDLYTPGNTGDYISDNKSTVYGPFETVTMRGWFGVADTEIKEYGYCIGDNAPVFSADFFTETEAAVKAAGGDLAVRYQITIPVADLGEEETVLMPVAKMEDDTVVAVTFYEIKYTTKAKPVTVKPVTHALTTGRTNNAVNFSSTEIGFKFNIPEGYKLSRFSILDSPTWNGPSTGVGLTATIYSWTNNDYEETIDGDALDEYFEEDHKDCATLNIEYNYIPAGDYLIVVSDCTGNIGGWEASAVADEYAETYKYFVNGEEHEPGVHVKMQLVPDDDPPAPTEKPTKAPATETPTAAPTEVPATEAPATAAPATDAPATEAPVDADPTAAPATQEPGKTEGGFPVGAVIGIIVGVVAVAAVIAGIVISKNKKK